MDVVHLHLFIAAELTFSVAIDFGFEDGWVGTFVQYFFVPFVLFNLNLKL